MRPFSKITVIGGHKRKWNEKLSPIIHSFAYHHHFDILIKIV
jgi:hypothetical protein